MVASLGNGQGIAVGPWRELIASKGGKRLAASSELGGEPPAQLIVLPYPTWELEDVTLVTHDRSQRAVLADIRARGLDIVFDYHHQSLYAAERGYIADAAGWLTWTSFFGSGDGLGADVRWVEDGAERLRAGKFRYFSPVVLYDEKTLEVTALLSVALTNTPRTNKQPPLTAESARSIITATRRLAASNWEGNMPKWVSILIDFLYGLYSYEAKDMLEHIDTARAKFVEVMGEGGAATAAAAADWKAKLPAGATLLEALIAGGLRVPGGSPELLAAAASTPEGIDDLCQLAGLPKGSDRKALAAHLVTLVTTMVPRSEVEKRDVELAAAAAREGKTRIDTLLASYSDRWAPAEEPQLRQLAATSYDAVEASLKARQPIVSTSQAKSPPVEEPAGTSLASDGNVTRMVIAGEQRVVSEEGLDTYNAVQRILAENGWGQSRYMDADRIRMERLAAAK
jgi:phage I-like protein